MLHFIIKFQIRIWCLLLTWTTCMCMDHTVTHLNFFLLATATRAMARATAVVGERRWQWSKAKDVGEGGKSSDGVGNEGGGWQRGSGCRSGKQIILFLIGIKWLRQRAMARAARAIATAKRGRWRERGRCWGRQERWRRRRKWVTKRTRAKRAANHFILIWNKMFDFVIISTRNYFVYLIAITIAAWQVKCSFPWAFLWGFLFVFWWAWRIFTSICFLFLGVLVVVVCSRLLFILRSNKIWHVILHFV